MNRYVFVFLILFVDLYSQVRIVTFHYNRPDFLELQIRALQKFLQDDYELIVFNDGPTETMAASIEEVCNRYQVQSIRYNQQWHWEHPNNEKLKSYLKDPKVKEFYGFREGNIDEIGNQGSVRHSHLIEFAMKNFGVDHDDLLVIMDGDMFPIRPLSIRALQKDKDVVGIYRNFPSFKLGYFWVPFLSLNMPKLPDRSAISFNLTVFKGYFLDTGSQFNYYLLDHPEITVQKFDKWKESSDLFRFSLERLVEMKFTPQEAELIKKVPKYFPVQFHVFNQLLHFSGSICEDLTVYEKKHKAVTKFLNKILEK